MEQSSITTITDASINESKAILTRISPLDYTTESPSLTTAVSVTNATNMRSLSFNNTAINATATTPNSSQTINHNLKTTTTTSLTLNTSIYNNTQQTHDDADDVLLTIEYIGNLLCFYYVPIIVGTGSLGNILSVVVFFKTKLRKLSSSFYLAALAISDTCFLLGLFAQWLNFVDVHIYNREYFCQFFTFFSSLACFCSVWFVVAFTVERFIAVMYPLKRQTMCTVRRAKMVLLGLTVLGCFHCVPFWISSTPVYSQRLEMMICDIKTEYKDYITLLNYWDTVVVFAVPFTAIAILNTFTGCTVWKFATVRRTLTMQKIKNHNIPVKHDITVAMAATTTCAATANATATSTLTSSVTGVATAAAAALDEQQQQSVTTTTTTYHAAIAKTSLKRQKLNNTCTKSHLIGIECGTNVAQHQHHTHSHPHRSTTIRHHHAHNPHSRHKKQKHHTHQDDSRKASVFKTERDGGCCAIHADIPRKSGKRKAGNSSQFKVTKMLLIVSTVFVCLNLPSCIMRIITFLETQTSTTSQATVLLQYFFHLLFITNFGINFILYCVSGQNFRKAVLTMFRRVSAAQRDGTTQHTVSEYYRNSAAQGGAAIMGSAGCGGSGSDYSAGGSNASTRRRMMSQTSWNDAHELQCFK